MTVPNSVDNLIVADMNRQANVQPAQDPVVANPVPEPSVTEVPRGTSEPDTNLTQDEPISNVAPETTKSLESSSKSVDSVGDKTSSVDEYGNPIEPPKTYTEEEVQNLIRQRLARVKNTEQPTQQQVRQATEEFKQDPNSEENWETQLETFIDKTIEKRQAKQTQQQWQAQESAKQADFEARFNTGMGKYSDFHQVVANKPITDSMMLAARGLENPAAFIYGAAKLHPQELTRIANIADPYAQAAEVGRLHERMVKTRNATSNAPKPLEAPKSDVTSKRVDERPPIDYLIQQHAKQKQARK